MFGASNKFLESLAIFANKPLFSPSIVYHCRKRLKECLQPHAVFPGFASHLYTCGCLDAERGVSYRLTLLQRGFPVNCCIFIHTCFNKLNSQAVP